MGLTCRPPPEREGPAALRSSGNVILRDKDLDMIIFVFSKDHSILHKVQTKSRAPVASAEWLDQCPCCSGRAWGWLGEAGDSSKNNQEETDSKAFLKRISRACFWEGIGKERKLGHLL